jgi:hypothetical protein
VTRQAWGKRPHLTQVLRRQPNFKKRQKTPTECYQRSQLRWLTPVIPATWEAEIRRIKARGQPQGHSSRDPISTSGWVPSSCL